MEKTVTLTIEVKVPRLQYKCIKSYYWSKGVELACTPTQTDDTKNKMLI